MKRRWAVEVTLIPKLLSALVRLTLTPQKPAATLAKVLHVQQFLNRSHFWLVTMEMWVMQWLQRVAAGGVRALQAAGSEGLKLLLYLGHWDAPAATCRQNFIMQEEWRGSNGVVGGGGVFTQGDIWQESTWWYELSGYFSTELSKKAAADMNNHMTNGTWYQVQTWSVSHTHWCLWLSKKYPISIVSK